MNVSWLQEPLTQVAILCGVLGIGLIGSLTLWISVKLEARAARSAFKVFRLSTEATIGDLSPKIEELRMVPMTDTVPSAITAVQGLNPTNRTKALRMHRRGESISSIAGSLGVQQEEIHLLLKLDRLLEVSTT